MVVLKSKEEIELIKISSLLVGETHAEVAKYLTDGVSTSKLDKIAEEFILDNNAKPAFKGYGGFPSTLCISINDEVVHGIPGNRTIKNGDLVSIDCGVEKNGFFGDSAFTFAVGEVDEDVLNLIKRTKESLYLGINAMKIGDKLGDIGYAIQSYVEEFGYGVVRELVGHGIGKHLHESPEVPNYGKRGTGIKITDGLVICIEPMINLGRRHIKQDNDGWTIRTVDSKPSAHFEHVVALVDGEVEILSSFASIEKVLNNIK